MATGGRKVVPLLTFEEIAKQLSGDFAAQDLKNPKPDTMLMVYDACCNSLDLELGQMVFRGTDHFEDPDLHRGSAVVIHMVFTLRRILQNVGFKDFKVDDICNPDPKRTRRILSILVAYFHFCASKQPKIAAIKEEVNAVTEMNDKMESRLDALRSEINKKVESLSQLRSAVKDMELTKFFEENRVKKGQIQKDYEECKKKLSEMEIELSRKQLARCQTEEKKQEYQRAIVQSPERVQLEMQQLIYKIEATMAEHKTIRADIEAHSTSCNNLQLLETSYVECVKSAHNAMELMKRLENFKQQSLEMEKNKSTIQQELDEMPARLEVLQKKLVMHQKMSSKEYKLINARMEDKKRQSAEKEKKLKLLQEKRKEHQREMAVMDEKEDQLTTAIQIEKDTIKFIQETESEEMLAIQTWLENTKKAKEKQAARITDLLQTAFAADNETPEV